MPLFRYEWNGGQCIFCVTFLGFLKYIFLHEERNGRNREILSKFFSFLPLFFVVTILLNYNTMKTSSLTNLWVNNIHDMQEVSFVRTERWKKKCKIITFKRNFHSRSFYFNKYRISKHKQKQICQLLVKRPSIKIFRYYQHPEISNSNPFLFPGWISV